MGVYLKPFFTGRNTSILGIPVLPSFAMTLENKVWKSTMSILFYICKLLGVNPRKLESNKVLGSGGTTDC